MEQHNTTTIQRCPACRITVVAGRIRWNCDTFHPEVSELIDEHEAREQDCPVAQEQEQVQGEQVHDESWLHKIARLRRTATDDQGR